MYKRDEEGLLKIPKEDHLPQSFIQGPKEKRPKTEVEVYFITHHK